jgi:hypothetical protein
MVNLTSVVDAIRSTIEPTKHAYWRLSPIATPALIIIIYSSTGDSKHKNCASTKLCVAWPVFSQEFLASLPNQRVLNLVNGRKLALQRITGASL